MAKFDYWLTKEGLILLEGWARDGLTDEQIAANVGISRSTLAEWKNKFSDISDSLKKGKEVIDIQVENALLKQALEGNTTAQIFWLKNRRPDKWRDKQEIDQTIANKDDKPFQMQHNLSKLSVEELKELESIISKTTDTG